MLKLWQKKRLGSASYRWTKGRGLSIFKKEVLKQLFLSSVTRRIVSLNLAALVVLLAGILYLNHFRGGLIDARIESLRMQGQLIAGAVASDPISDQSSFFSNPDALLNFQVYQAWAPGVENWIFPISPEYAARVLQQLIDTKRMRIQIYDRATNLLFDSNTLSLDSIRISPEQQSYFAYDPGEEFAYSAPDSPIEQEHDIVLDTSLAVREAALGYGAPSTHRNHAGQLVISMALPIKRLDRVIGVLLLSTIACDIDRIINNERDTIIKVFAVVSVVLLLLSLFLAYTIAAPLRKLAVAADKVRVGVADRLVIPDFSCRQDEVGHLSASLRAMTEALYSRLEAIEHFAADVSHELKNPLTSLRSAVETLPLAKTEQAKERLLEIIYHDIQRLDRLITDISAASRLDAELGRESFQPVDVAALLTGIVQAAQLIDSKHANITIDLDICPLNEQDSYVVNGHELRLSEVIENILANARSFVPQDGGHISIGLRHDSAKLQIRIADNGPGIKGDDIERIFERFYTDRPSNEAFGNNSGLGLSISRQIIEAHGGTLTAENIYEPENADEKRGACFIIQLPLLHSAPASLASVS